MEVTKETYERECKRRFGMTNPERMASPVWEWMVRRGTNPWVARKDLGLEGHYGGGDPDWCFDRMGMSRTRMPDGRVVCIAGEHEDSYDPGFCIYNDIVVLRPAEAEQWSVTPSSGEVEVFGYPERVFPPTDFHSATLVGDRIYIIGRIGYQGTRQPGHTPVLALDTSIYEVAGVATSGECPGWVHGHHASYDAATHSIIVRGGKVMTSEDSADMPSLAAHRLHLEGLRWEVISEREERRYFTIKSRACEAAWTENVFWPRTVPYEWMAPEDRGVMTYRISVTGVRVIFIESAADDIDVRIEGPLRPEVEDAMLREVAANLESQTGAEWRVEERAGPDGWLL